LLAGMRGWKGPGRVSRMRFAKDSLISLSSTPLMKAFFGWISGRSISGILVVR
jgi:hypothetical protein